MKTATYESLKKKNYDEVAYHFHDLVRDRLFVEAPVPLVVAASILASVMKDELDSSDAVRYLQERIDDETTISFLQKVEKEYKHQIADLSRKFDVDTLKAAALFSEPKRFSEAGMFATPEGISDLAISLLSLTANDVILDLGSGVSSFLIQAALKSGSEKIYGVEINTDAVIVANLRCFIMDLPIKTIQGNMISQDFRGLSANKVFSNFPLGVRFPHLEKYIGQNPILKKHFEDARKTISGDWVFSLASYLNTKMPGKTVLLMSNAGTWNKPDEFIRKRLLEDGLVEGVISLPPRLLSSTAIPLTMMVLSQNNGDVRMVDASEMFTDGRRQNLLQEKDVENITKAYYHDSAVSRTVTIDEVAQQEFILNPQRYIGIDTGITGGIPLGELCVSINRGAMIRPGELDALVSKEETNYHYLMLQNIQDGFIDSNLLTLTDIDEKYEKYCIIDESLIVSRTSPFKVAMAHVSRGEKILANGNLYFIELDGAKVNPVFAQLFLQSEAGMTQLNRLAKGAVVGNISIRDLKTIQIPNVPREKQDSIVEEYNNLNDELVVLERQADIIRDKRARLLEGVI